MTQSNKMRQIWAVGQSKILLENTFNKSEMPVSVTRNPASGEIIMKSAYTLARWAQNRLKTNELQKFKAKKLLESENSLKQVSLHKSTDH